MIDAIRNWFVKHLWHTPQVLAQQEIATVSEAINRLQRLADYHLEMAEIYKKGVEDLRGRR